LFGAKLVPNFELTLPRSSAAAAELWQPAKKRLLEKHGKNTSLLF